MKAEIINVGTELLLGSTLNTNAKFLSQRLAELGEEVYFHTVVGDNRGRLKGALNLALKRSQLIILTGGLGPTQDDLTKEVVCETLNLKLNLNEEVLNEIKRYFNKLHREMSGNNIKQAYIPENSIVLKNDIGTAPGVLVNWNDKKIAILPGPPNEMKTMFNKYLSPLIKENYIIKSKTLKTIGISESTLELMIKDFIDSQTNPTIATYVKEGQVDVKITAKEENKDNSDDLINDMVEKVEKRIGKYIYSYDDETIEEALYKILKDRGFKIAFCESCTGGLVSSRFTKIPGVSQVFDRGIVTYSNRAKVEELNVKEDTLRKYGAVSEETAIEMAEGLLKKSNVDIALSTTGIAGPDGGSEEKPVGLVYIGVATKEGSHAVKFTFPGNRISIQNRTATMVFDEGRKCLLKLNN